MKASSPLVSDPNTPSEATGSAFPPPQSGHNTETTSSPDQKGAGFPAPQRRETPTKTSREQTSRPRPRQHRPNPQGQRSGLTAETLMENIGSGATVRPEAGMRGFLYRVSNGRINLGRSAHESLEDQLRARVRQPLGDGVYHVMIFAQKGGVGKTTITTAVGVTTAGLRTDKITGVDVNPDGGSLAIRVPRTTTKTVLDLRDALRAGEVSPVEFDRYVNHASHRFDTIVMPPGMKPEYPLSADDHRMISEALEKKYPYKIVYTDCGTNVTDDVMASVIPKAHQMIVVTTTVQDEATVTAGGLDSLERMGRGDLVRNAVTVLVEKAPRDSNVDTQRIIDKTAADIEHWFEQRTSTVIKVPYDSVIRLGKIYDPAAVSDSSRLAHLKVGAEVMDRLAAYGNAD